MSRPEWSFQTRAGVSASPERVAAWWFDPERQNDLPQLLERSGSRDPSATYSTTNGVRTRVLQWKDRRGWDNHHHQETHVGPDGLPERAVNGFVARTHEVATYESSKGVEWTIACNGQIEFIAKSEGQHTEIVVTHHHLMVGGTRIQQWIHRRQELINSDRFFQDLAAQCRAAVGIATA